MKKKKPPLRLLIVKTSSMGDIIHTLPALNDAFLLMPDMICDWVVEENFAEIPRWHPAVRKVIPVAWRRWRKSIFSSETQAEWAAFRENLGEYEYDLVIDAQGLFKSAFLSLFARGFKVGFDSQSARERWASLFYQHKFPVGRKLHAVFRLRCLFSQALNYTLPEGTPSYGVDKEQFLKADEATVPAKPYVVFLHGTTWDTKHWPELYWEALAKLVNQAGFDIKIPWGNPRELERAKRIATTCTMAEILPKLDLAGMAKVLAGARAAVAVDTGLGHLCAALNVPTVSLYGPTNAKLTGAVGGNQTHLSAKFECAPCLQSVCTYQGSSPLVKEVSELAGAGGGDISLKSDSPLKPPSPLYPSCFIGLGPDKVWDALVRVL